MLSGLPLASEREALAPQRGVWQRMGMSRKKPLVAVIPDRRQISEQHFFHMVGEKYLRALVIGADVYPVMVPALGGELEVADILERVDGLFLPGSPSNVEPSHYHGQPSKPGTWHDVERDDIALPLIPAAIRCGMPLFAVCRGFQEMNVAFGGTLHQLVHEVPGFQVHKENPDDPLDVQYGPSHDVSFTAGGLLEVITGKQTATVNSLHSQAIDGLADGLRVEAIADDGLVEAFVVNDAPGFTLGLQWHPEWAVTENADSMAIFQAFGEACRSYRDQ
jgi:putative glutamine amidotransferase